MDDKMGGGWRGCAGEFVRSVRGEGGKRDGGRRADVKEEGGEGSSHRVGDC